MKPIRLLAALLLLPVAAPVAAADWQVVVRDRNRQVEIDRSSIFDSDRGTKVSWARVVLTSEEAKSAGYATIKALNRYDCINRSFLTVKRVYLDAQEQIVREESAGDQAPMLVTRNSVDERLWREVCRPPTTKDLEKVADEAVKATAGTLDAKKEVRAPAPPPTPAARPAPKAAPVAEARPEPIAKDDPAARPAPIAARDTAAAQARTGEIKPAEGEKPSGSIVPPLPKISLPPPPERDAGTAAKAEAKAEVKAQVGTPPPKTEVKADVKAEVRADVRPEPKPARAATPTAPLARLAEEQAPPTTAPRRAFIEDEEALARILRRRDPPAVESAARKPVAKAVPSRAAAAATGAGEGTWSYQGENGPDQWGKLRPDWKLCSSGTRQSPIDLREGVGVDLEPVKFDYRPSRFRVTDTGNTLQVDLDEPMGIEVRGRRFLLERITLHRPSQERIGGMAHDMVAHFRHRDPDGNVAVLAVLLAAGAEANPALQMLWNNLPLDKGRSYAPAASIDLGQLLPGSPAHYLYIGSLPEPPCTEDVLWVVMKQPVGMSAEQLAVFARLYPRNSRPIQPANGRLVLESR
ncbi:MAG: carbonic anhydrase family protein [Thauera sp.]|nr:carbonic anhydrase family protein [Thauera sp.]